MGYFGHFFQNVGKNEFSRKKGLCQILDIPNIYHHAKNQKKLISHSREKSRTDKRSDRQQWFSRGFQKMFSLVIFLTFVLFCFFYDFLAISVFIKTLRGRVHCFTYQYCWLSPDINSCIFSSTSSLTRQVKYSRLGPRQIPTKGIWK